mmetsp:Transcript_28717/g.66648  ORF Transcript_28717/g.66648 Transcript_28717/m.66648 type:complete len:337 (-) Transcript_28717:92-1102(-)
MSGCAATGDSVPLRLFYALILLSLAPSAFAGGGSGSSQSVRVESSRRSSAHALVPSNATEPQKAPRATAPKVRQENSAPDRPVATVTSDAASTEKGVHRHVPGRASTWTTNVLVSVGSDGEIRSISQSLPDNHSLEVVTSASDPLGALEVATDDVLVKAAEAAAAAGAAVGAAAAMRAVAASPQGPVAATATAAPSVQGSSEDGVQHRISKSTLILLQLLSASIALAIAWRNVKKLFVARRTDDEIAREGSMKFGSQLRVSLKMNVPGGRSDRASLAAAGSHMPPDIPVGRGRSSTSSASLTGTQSSGSGAEAAPQDAVVEQERERPGSPDRGGGG